METRAKTRSSVTPALNSATANFETGAAESDINMGSINENEFDNTIATVSENDSDTQKQIADHSESVTGKETDSPAQQSVTHTPPQQFDLILFLQTMDAKLANIEQHKKEMDSKFDSINMKLDSTNNKIDSTNTELLANIEQHKTGMDSKFDSLNMKLDSTNNKIDSINTELLANIEQHKTEIISAFTSLEHRLTEHEKETREFETTLRQEIQKMHDENKAELGTLFDKHKTDCDLRFANLESKVTASVEELANKFQRSQSSLEENITTSVHKTLEQELGEGRTLHSVISTIDSTLGQHSERLDGIESKLASVSSHPSPTESASVQDSPAFQALQRQVLGQDATIKQIQGTLTATLSLHDNNGSDVHSLHRLGSTVNQNVTFSKTLAGGSDSTALSSTSPSCSPNSIPSTQPVQNSPVAEDRQYNIHSYDPNGSINPSVWINEVERILPQSWSLERTFSFIHEHVHPDLFNTIYAMTKESNSFPDFKQKFLQSFWSSAHQNQLYSDILSGAPILNTNYKSYVSYFEHLQRKNCFLDRKLTDEDLIHCFIRKLPNEVQTALLNSRGDSIPMFHSKLTVTVLFNKAPDDRVRERVRFPYSTPRRHTDVIRTCLNNIQSAAQKRSFFKNTGLHNRTFFVGQKVLIRSHKLSRKARYQFQKFLNLYLGPFRIKRIAHPNVVEVETIRTKRSIGIYHVSAIRPFIS